MNILVCEVPEHLKGRNTATCSLFSVTAGVEDRNMGIQSLVHTAQLLVSGILESLCGSHTGRGGVGKIKHARNDTGNAGATASLSFPTIGLAPCSGWDFRIMLYNVQVQECSSYKGDPSPRSPLNAFLGSS